MTIPKVLKRYSHMIEAIEDYREQGIDGDGYWVHLKPGWINTLHETHSVHEDGPRECLGIFPFVSPCRCIECLKLKGE